MERQLRFEKDGFAVRFVIRAENGLASILQETQEGFAAHGSHGPASSDEAAIEDAIRVLADQYSPSHGWQCIKASAG
jgi:hypothetical protein